MASSPGAGGRELDLLTCSPVSVPLDGAGPSCVDRLDYCQLYARPHWVSLSICKRGGGVGGEGGNTPWIP